MAKKIRAVNQAVILAGGLATRLHPITKKIPKAMVPIKGRPFLEYELDLCKKNGIKEAIICVGHLSGQIKNYFGSGRKFGVKISYSKEDKKLDTGGALKKALPYLDKEFIVTYGDSYLDIDWQEAFKFYKKSGARGLMTVYKNNWKFVPSTTLVDKKGYVTEFNKENPRSEMCHMEYGINIFCKEIIGKVHDETFPLGEYFNLLAREKQLIALETDVMFYDMGTPEGIKKLSEIV